MDDFEFWVPTGGSGPVGPTRYSYGDAPENGIINFRVETRGGHGGFRIPKGQPGGGQYTSAQRGFYARNYDLALRVQGQVVENIAHGILRRGVSTGRLLKVTANRGNRRVSSDGFSVGIEDYLDTSIAKYWRTIEEGSETVWADVAGGRPSMIGLPLKGEWGASIIGLRQTADGLRALAGPEFSSMSNRQSDKFRPRKKGKFVRKGEVKNEIEPKWAYREAFEDIDVARQSRANLAQYLDDISNLKLPPIID